MKKLLLSTLMLFVSICGFAYDCEVDGIYYNLNTTDYTASVTYNSSDIGYSGVVRIPEEIAYNGTTFSVISIDNYAFRYCSELIELTIGSSVTSIGNEAFRYCSSLTELTIGNSVTFIGNYAFAGCSGLTELTIPNSVTSIGYWAFSSCNGLEKIVVESGNLYYDSREDCNAVIRKDGNVLIVGCKNTLIPNSVTSIGYLAFYGCSGLTELTIPDNVTSIGDYAFWGCSGLTELTIGNGVTSIGDDAFWNCSGLTELTIGNSVTSIGDYAFFKCIGLTELIIPNSVISIGDYAFNYCIGLTELTIGNGVTSIGNYAFQDCKGLTELTIGNGVTFIGSSAFSGCSGLTELTIGNNVTTIRNSAFNPCTSLISITSLNITPPICISSSIFGGTTPASVQLIYKNVTLHVPAGCKLAYEQAAVWGEFLNIQEDAQTDEESDGGDDDTDGIDAVNIDKDGANVIYTIDGKQLNTTTVSNLPTGIYIVNGKKVVVK